MALKQRRRQGQPAPSFTMQLSALRRHMKAGDYATFAGDGVLCSVESPRLRKIATAATKRAKRNGLKDVLVHVDNRGVRLLWGSGALTLWNHEPDFQRYDCGPQRGYTVRLPLGAPVPEVRPEAPLAPVVALPAVVQQPAPKPQELRRSALQPMPSNVIRLPVRQTHAEQALDLYHRASAIDEDPATVDQAEAMYRSALALDPELDIALTNLGNIYFRRRQHHEAESMYRQAFKINPKQAEAFYNLGFLYLERGEYTEAIALFERSIANDPEFADAHFNLAGAHDALGDRVRARPHWRRYLQLDPDSSFADYARRALGDPALKLVGGAR